MDAQNSTALALRKRPRLACRRLAAWGLEVGLVAISAVLPFWVGRYVLVTETAAALFPAEDVTEAAPSDHQPLEPTQAPSHVALNPLVHYVQQGWARIAQIPPHQLHRTLPRLTNILWTVALVAPVAAAGVLIVQLSYTGRTWPKRWLGIQVFSLAGGHLRLHQVLGRELVRWGVPLLIVWGGTSAAGFSLGVWTPVVVGLLAFGESVTAVVHGQRAWHDRIARTQVGLAHGAYRAVSSESLVPVSPWNELVQLSQGERGIQLHGETVNDDDWWLLESEGNLTSLVLPPRANLVQTHDSGGSLTLVSSVPRKSWLFLTGGMLLACAAGFGIGRATQSSASMGAEGDIFLETAQTLTANSRAGGDYSAAILMLAQVDDPRTAHYLADLLSQSSQPKTLATLQQALVSQGLDSLPSLLALSRILESDLQQPLVPDARHIRLEQRHIVQGAIAKLLTVHSGELIDISLDRVNLGQYQDAEHGFQLIQPGLLAAGTSWQRANLSQANLTGASFFDVGADGKPDSYDDVISDLSGITLVAARLEQANLQGVQLSYANLRRADLTDANLTHSNLEGSQLTNARLMQVDASQSRWRGINLVGADLTQAILDGADLSQARLNRLEAAHSSWAKATLLESDWVGANLIGADFSQTDLVGANFQGANLDSADFTRADLRQVDFRDADLRQATLSGVNLTDADLAGAIFDDGSTVNDSFITPNAQLSSDNHLQGVNFSRARNLDRRQLNYICAQGGVHPACQDGVTPES